MQVWHHTPRCAPGSGTVEAENLLVLLMLTDAAAWSAVQTNSTWHILETKPSAYSTSGVIMEQLPQKAEGKVLGKC